MYRGSVTLESSFIVPFFTMIVVALVAFNLELHERIDEKAIETRRTQIERFEEHKGCPQELIWAYVAMQKVNGK